MVAAMLYQGRIIASTTRGNTEEDSAIEALRLICHVSFLLLLRRKLSRITADRLSLFRSFLGAALRCAIKYSTTMPFTDFNSEHVSYLKRTPRPGAVVGKSPGTLLAFGGKKLSPARIIKAIKAENLLSSFGFPGHAKVNTVVYSNRSQYRMIESNLELFIVDAHDIIRSTTSHQSGLVQATKATGNLL